MRYNPRYPSTKTCGVSLHWTACGRLIHRHGFGRAFDPRQPTELARLESHRERRYGVSISFVISGFLITSLLLREHHETGRISLKSFYVRRAFRILPPFYAFLFLPMLLRTTGVLDFSLQ